VGNAPLGGIPGRYADRGDEGEIKGSIPPVICGNSPGLHRKRSLDPTQAGVYES
jgi:hypothetical protein